MSFALSCRKLIGTRINNIYKVGGYVSRNAASVEEYKIKWVRPPRIPEIHPEQSGDLGLDVPIQSNDLALYYNRSKELDDASDIVRRIFTLKFQPFKETRSVKREKIIGLVKRHVCDRGSTEVAIAAMTSEIQDIQKYLELHPRNRPTKVFLKELIDKRRKYLNRLRKWDYRRFEWVLERLNLVYKPHPEQRGMVSRKDSIRIMTKEYCDNIIQQKLDAYKAELRAQQKDFYREKAEKLAFIMKEEKECGLKPTVTAEDIEEIQKKIQEL